jgi:hypothetical protein
MNARTRAVRRTVVGTVITGMVTALGLLAPSSANAAASDCAAGYLCVWDGANYTGNKCSWQNADADWWSGSVVCSWADDRVVKSIYNHGTSSAYAGVTIYYGANYASPIGCVYQGQMGTGTGVMIRSHKWTTTCTN